MFFNANNVKKIHTFLHLKLIQVEIESLVSFLIYEKLIIIIKEHIYLIFLFPLYDSKYDRWNL